MNLLDNLERLGMPTQAAAKMPTMSIVSDYGAHLAYIQLLFSLFLYSINLQLQFYIHPAQRSISWIR
jgi:hypothetical protein